MSGSSLTTIRTIIAGESFNSSVSRSNELESVFKPSIPAAITATLSTRTDNDTGILTVATGHGITTSDKLSLFWNGGYKNNVTVTATTSTTISIDLGTGDNLPVLNASLNVGKEEEHTLTIDGDLLTVLAIDSANRSTIHFRDSDDDSLLVYSIQANEGPIWVEGMGQVNPLADADVANVVVANGGLTPLILKVGMLINTN